MARKAASPTRIPRKRPLKRSTLSSDSLFGFGTPSSSASTSRQLSVPRFNLSQGTGKSPRTQVIDLTEDDGPPPIPIPVPVAKKPRMMSPSPLANPPAPKARETNTRQGGESRDEPGHEESLWVDLHAPETRDTLAVHPRKVEDVRRWLDEALTGGPTGKLRKYRRILVLTGPSGSGKTATLQVLAKEFEAEVVEWYASSDEFSTGGDYDYESATTKLVSFLERASVYESLSFNAISNTTSGSTPKDDQKQPESKHKILLLEDFPSLSHPRVRSAFHAALVKFAEATPSSSATVSSLSYPPLVLIISDAGLRADDTSPYSSSHRDDVLDIRTVLPPALLGSHYVTQIKFNPIATTFMRKALVSVISSHLSSISSNIKSKTNSLPKETVDALIEAASGDIRSAITGVQFAFTAASRALPDGDGRKKLRPKGRGGAKGERDAALKAMFSTVTRREQALALFHLLGKVFYNKRFGDPEEPGDAPTSLVKPLPKHLKEFERRPSKVDVSTLHADSPVDASLFSLYIQQNYTQFCDDVDECYGLADALSEADGGMGILDDNFAISSALSQHTFQHIARSALLSLPSPVPRRSQVVRKPTWFAARAKEREGEGALEDAKQWLIERGGTNGLGCGYWDRKSVVLDAGGLLGRLGSQGPPSAQLFTQLKWDVPSSQAADALDEEEAVTAGVDTAEADVEAMEKRAAGVGKAKDEKDDKQYLSDDDIEDF
ncbi:Checkpoint protein rad17 [Schizosaccharomyces pombe 972h-] [Rhizoctonia solani]|uniref:Checkpoint protein rad17 [Schizosaccharomyces pombe 972h-] n=1 Tax=Rhizoctonia solani TaxID=456999 RepID=A0A0K6FUX1_9AGAM|nr:Checkpoint protein rad17 [Schizosaccharomyces pombe 972h-] [Rhizoctonia solani]